jgi:type IV pilus assembly protein PilC
MPTPAELEKILKQRRAWQKAPRREKEKTGFRFVRPIRTRELTDFTRQLATMVGARLPLAKSLGILVLHHSHPQMQRVLQAVLHGVTHGQSLSDSLAKFPKVFSPLFVNLVRAGEVSGNLPEILQQLAGYLEKMGELRRKLLTAMAYPAVIVLVAFGAIGFLLFGILPMFTDLFREFGAPMPLPARVLLGTTEFLHANFFYIFLLLLAATVLTKNFVQTAKGRWTLDAIKIKLPLIGAIVKKVLIARFSRTLGALLRSGVSLLEALEITARSAGNQLFAQEVARMKLMATRGELMEKAISGSKLFPPLVAQMIAVGEETAELDSLLTKTAEFYESEVDAAIEALTSIIEPVVIVVLGVVLGGAMIAIYLQIFDLMNVIQ